MNGEVGTAIAAARACRCRCERCGSGEFTQHEYVEVRKPVLVLWTLRGRAVIGRKGQREELRSHATNVRCAACGTPIEAAPKEQTLAGREQ